METSSPNLLYPDPKTRINEKWFLNTDDLKTIVSEFDSNSKIKNFVDNYTINGFDQELYQQAFLQVVAETVYNYPSTFISEKTIKPIVSKRPFIIVGPAGSLKNLQTIGFKTFSDYWDESYDLIANPELRFLKILETIEKICQLSLSDLQSLCNDMEFILNYNFEFYKYSFFKDQITQFQTLCKNNLGLIDV